MADEQVEEMVHDMIMEAAFGDSERAAGLLRTLGLDQNAHGMFVVCATVAEYGAVSLRRRASGVPLGGDAMVIPARAARDDANNDPPGAFAERFLAAWTNGDPEMCRDLFIASLELTDQQHVDGVAALVSLTGHVVRSQYEEECG